MKKLILVVLTTFVLCFGMAGCGGGSAEDTGDSVEQTENTMIATIVGTWECVDMTMEDNGVEMNKDDLEGIFSKKVNEMAAITANEDGTGEITFMDIAGSMTWTESEGVFTIVLDDSDDEDAAPLKAELDEGRLMVTSETSYLSEGTEVKSVITMTFEYVE